MVADLPLNENADVCAAMRNPLIFDRTLRDAEIVNVPFLDGTGGRIASLLRVCVALPHGAQRNNSATALRRDVFSPLQARKH